MYVVLICIMLKSSSTSFGKLLQFVSNILLCFSVSVVSSFFFFFCKRCTVLLILQVTVFWCIVLHEQPAVFNYSAGRIIQMIVSFPSCAL